MARIKKVSMKSYVEDFVQNSGLVYEGQTDENMRFIGVVAYFATILESAENLTPEGVIAILENKSDHVASIIGSIHKASPTQRVKHLKYLRTALAPDDYEHIRKSLLRTPAVKEAEAPVDEPDQLMEALRSRKSYSEMRGFIAAAPNNHFEHNARSIMKHGLGNDDHAQNDYARHSVLFDHRLTDKHLDDISQHVASGGTTTNTLDKNFHKNVHSVGVLRAAMKNDSPDVIADAKKGITADHKNAIFDHGTHEEKAFVLHHGLANKSQLSSALTGGNDALKAVAKSHLQSLKDSGSSKHEDLYHHLNAPADKESFFSRVKNSFKSNLAKRMSAAAEKPKERKDPTFEDHIGALIAGITTNKLHEAKTKLNKILGEKAAVQLAEHRQEIVEAKYNNTTEE